MRMDTAQETSSDLVNKLSEKTTAIIRRYGEERWALESTLFVRSEDVRLH